MLPLNRERSEVDDEDDDVKMKMKKRKPLLMPHHSMVYHLTLASLRPASRDQADPSTNQLQDPTG